MTLWRAGAGGDRVHFHDEVLDLAVLVFTEAERIYAEVALTGLGRPEPFRQVLGPFAHLAAVADAVTGYLIRVEAEDDDGVITVRQVPDADLPQPPAVPAAAASSRMPSGSSRQASTPPVRIRHCTSGAVYSASVWNSPPKSASE